MSFSSRGAFEHRLKALGPDPSLDDQDSQMTDSLDSITELAYEPDVDMVDAEIAPKLKGACTIGNHFNLELLSDVARLYDINYVNFGGWNGLKNLLSWQKVFGYVQRFVPACDAQLIVQGLYYVFDDGEQARRTLSFRIGGGKFFPLDSDPSVFLGYNSGVGSWRGWRREGGGLAFSKLCQTKSIRVRIPSSQGIARAGVS